MKEFNSITRRVIAIFAAIMVWVIIGMIVLWYLQWAGITRIGLKFVLFDIACLAVTVWCAVHFVGRYEEPRK